MSGEMTTAQSTHVRRVVDLSEVGLADVGLVGGKGANLGEMISAGFPVPPVFVITAGAHLDAMDDAGLRDELAEHARTACELSPEALAEAARRAKDSVRACVLHTRHVVCRHERNIHKCPRSRTPPADHPLLGIAVR